ncbi:unnamed protein product [Caenorhabditis angaria]|uniref:Uncharacterized protein n=1 Tax=Caenorhabditis angaria TaxID=860376 RepID=A0A9P1IYR5_9PELO|nr:unnamed protein product [Caenorhabditis angaria]
MSLNNLLFDIPLWYICSFHILGTLSILLNTFGMYLLIYKTDKMDKYKIYLFAFQFMTTIVDLTISFAVQPVSLLPIWAAHTSTGLLWKLFKVSPHIALLFLLVTLELQIVTLVLCFVKKHESITLIEFV